MFSLGTVAPPLSHHAGWTHLKIGPPRPCLDRRRPGVGGAPAWRARPNLCRGLSRNGVQARAASTRSASPAFARGLDAALAGAPGGATSRDRGRQLGEALWSLVSDSDDPAAARLLALLQQEALRTMGEDNAWMCPEAIASLT